MLQSKFSAFLALASLGLKRALAVPLERKTLDDK
jgi:hypothetical protein